MSPKNTCVDLEIGTALEKIRVFCGVSDNERLVSLGRIELFSRYILTVVEV